MLRVAKTKTRLSTCSVTDLLPSTDMEVHDATSAGSPELELPEERDVEDGDEPSTCANRALVCPHPCRRLW